MKYQAEVQEEWAEAEVAVIHAMVVEVAGAPVAGEGAEEQVVDIQMQEQ